jgi:thermostable 8-oxoguanine DNA glycosylase
VAVTPERLTNFKRTQSELEQLLIFSVAVAGKTAKTTARAIEKFFEGCNLELARPTDFLYMWFCDSDETVLNKLKAARTGNYTRLLKFLKELVENTPTLENMTVDSLRKFHGISFKTSKMIILHSRPGERHAVIDTHVIKFLRAVLKLDGLPKSTPNSQKKYDMLEDAFLRWVDERIKYQKHICIPNGKGGLMDRCVVIERDPLTGRANYAKLDLDLWNVYSGNGRD